MKKSILTLFLLASITPTVQAQRISDCNNHYQGKVDEKSRVYDSNNRYQGKVDDRGRVYDNNNRYKGKIDERGCAYDSNNRYLGKAENVSVCQAALRFFFKMP